VVKKNSGIMARDKHGINVRDTVVQTLTDIEGDFSDKVVPSGSLGTVVECYENFVSPFLFFRGLFWVGVREK